MLDSVTNSSLRGEMQKNIMRTIENGHFDSNTLRVDEEANIKLE